MSLRIHIEFQPKSILPGTDLHDFRQIPGFEVRIEAQCRLRKHQSRLIDSGLEARVSGQGEELPFVEVAGEFQVFPVVVGRVSGTGEEAGVGRVVGQPGFGVVDDDSVTFVAIGGSGGAKVGRGTGRLGGGAGGVLLQDFQRRGVQRELHTPI